MCWYTTMPPTARTPPHLLLRCGFVLQSQSLAEEFDGCHTAYDSLITSCQGWERSADWKEKGHGVLTWALAEGLKGNADSACGDGDERVTLGELARWLKLRVPTAARKAGGEQNPVADVPGGWENVYLTR